MNKVNKNKNPKEKQYNGKFNKDLKNDPYKKNLQKIKEYIYIST